MPEHDPFSPDSAVPALGSDEKPSEVAPDLKDDVKPTGGEPVPAKDADEKPAAPATTPADAPGDDVVDVPEGTVKEILEWVGDDEDKALAALEAEQNSNEPRSSLIDSLEKKLS